MAKEKRFQILVRRAGEDRYKFVAHGAVWGEAEAKDFLARYQERGDKIRLIQV